MIGSSRLNLNLISVVYLKERRDGHNANKIET
jgi:hypothetical protein